MAVVKDFLTPTGVVATYHRLIKVELNANTGEAELMLAIYSSPEAKAEGAAPLWHEYVRVPVSDFEQNPFSAFYPVLTSHPSSYLLDGVNDAAPSDMAFSVANSVLSDADPEPLLLDTLRQSRLQTMKDRRDEEEFGSFDWDGSTFDASAESVGRLIGAVMMAQWAQAAGQPFSISWTLADNTERTLSGADLVAAAQALGAHTLQAHNKYKSVKAEILAAQTPLAVTLVNWPK